MTADELAQRLRVGGHEVRVKGEEVVVRVCFFCGNARWNLELNPSRGLFNCWACKSGKGQRLDSVLSRVLGEKVQLSVSAVDDKRKLRQERTPASAERSDEDAFVPIPVGSLAASYLLRRGITPALVTQYGLRLCVNPEHRLVGRIVLPLNDYWTNERAGWVGRTYTGRNPKYLSLFEDGRKVITGWRAGAVRMRGEPVVMVEGPFDGIAVHQAGYSTAVLSGVGGKEVIEWAARLPMDTPVCIMLDADARTRAEQIVWQLLPVRPTGNVVIVPMFGDEDPGQFPPEMVRDRVVGAVRQLAGTNKM